MSIILYLIVGGLIGWVAGLILGKDIPGGIIGNMVAGILGSWLGGKLLGSWGWEVQGFYVFPSIIGGVILVFVASLILRGMNK
ncbi:GlsB/YeaQ/YmgE family stress response membrane protein [Viridibacillus sp. NPDC096237]|uniref:GlsB/YeaQ/YmgE family stress response membrane protein n=1 Tax=Viridibacillus sp. NPDC096237 TaxID=3390721 RepID=UPI003D08A60D